MQYHLQLRDHDNHIFIRLGPFASYEELDSYYCSGLVQGKLKHPKRSLADPVFVDGDLEFDHHIATLVIEIKPNQFSIPQIIYHPLMGGYVDWSKITG
jgi:hypothetical protein